MSRLVVLLGPCLANLAAAAPAPPPSPGDLAVVERPGIQLPLEAGFVDEASRPVRLGDLFDGRRPVLLVPAYYECPMLCGLLLEGVAAGLRLLRYGAASDFRVVTVSFDPADTPARARRKQAAVLAAAGLADDAALWPFLSGPPEAIEALVDALGLRLVRDPKTRQVAHAPVVVAVAPDGRIARYLHGLELPARDLRLALYEAAAGRAVPTTARVLLACYRYDPARRGYALAIERILQVAGGATVLVLGALLAILWTRDRRRGP